MQPDRTRITNGLFTDRLVIYDSGEFCQLSFRISYDGYDRNPQIATRIDGVPIEHIGKGRQSVTA
jgi:hypothetical protein